MQHIHITRHSKLEGHQGAVYALTPYKDGFISTGGDGWMVYWKAEHTTGKLLAKTASQVFSLAYIDKQNLLVAGNMEGGIHFIDLTQKQDIKNVAHHRLGVFGMKEFQGRLLTIGGGGMLTKWNTESLVAEESLSITNTSLRCLDTSEDTILIGASDHHVYELDTSFNIKNNIGNAHANSVFSIQYDLNKKSFFSGGRDAILKQWDSNFNIKNEQSAHWFSINDLKLNPSGKILATASRDKSIRIWDAENLRLIKELNLMRDNGHSHSVNCLLWLDEETLVSGSDDRNLIIWKIKQDHDT